jgi:hypothetical protein
MAKAMNMAGYDYFEREGAYFRRRSGKATRAVDDVLHGDKWVPYEGDRLDAGAWSDPCEDPLGGGRGGSRDMTKDTPDVIP